MLIVTCSVSWMDLWQYDSSTLRGLAWRTKTCTSGVPWGIQCSGFLSKSSFHWVHKFLITLDAVYRHSDPSQIDFLLPSVDENGPRAPLTPMTYPEALYFVRRFIELPWRSSKLVFPDVTHYTVHGLKSTLISWASQLGISPELRRLQGKHKDPLQSTRLYSRDDVAGSLSLQSEILQRVQAGWRPQTPLQRGGQLPLVEPGFTLESFHKEAPSHAWQFFNFQPELCPVAFELEADSVDLSSDDSSSSEFSGASSNSVAKVPTKKQKSRPSITADEATVGIYRNMWHIVAQQSSSTSDTQPDAAPIITACGRKFSSVQFSITDFLELKSGQSVCMHPGCRKGWIAIGVYWSGQAAADAMASGHRTPICLKSLSDNTGAEASSNKLFSMNRPLCYFLERLCLLSAQTNMEIDVGHIPGHDNVLADNLSRWDFNSSPPGGMQLSDRVRLPLKELWRDHQKPGVFPPGCHVPWSLPK
ncbi:unnamed protein product [Durusdinium trenchii]|uniref:Tyr recombinase domain-containing protein n=1 Tax=Durusdinium trenchii TaxID=1381693 RepID=A0ABP0NP32_9DINO